MDHEPYFTFLNPVPHKEPSPKHIKINIQNQEAISKFINEITLSDIYNKLNQSPSADPNINYNILRLDQMRKKKHMPGKIGKTQNQYGLHVHGLLKSIRYRDKLYKTLKMTWPDSSEHFALLINLTMYNSILKKYTYSPTTAL